MPADVDAMLEEMQRLLAAEFQPGDPGLTVNEWADRLGVSATQARRRLNVLWRRGLVEVGWRAERFMDGRLGRLPVYRPKP
jgi:predicted ArsR family transcriptional regulator